MRISVFLVLLITCLSLFSADKPDPLEVGDVLPAVSLQNQNGVLVDVSGYKGKWVVLYFYPKDDTSGCRKEALAFTRLKREYTAENAVIFGVNPASSKSHKKFEKKYKLKIDLLVDNEKKLMAMFGIKSFLGFCSRDTILINPKGKVEKIYRGVSPEGSPVDILDYIRSH
ncbi:MAG: peroxiredoxin [Acidobacteria bacterium]|nr:peroxiredoxin [Acidobacteriota bacterium]